MISKKDRIKLKKFINDNDIALLDKIGQRRETADFFFSKRDEFKWLEPLLILGYFDPNNAPGPIISNEKRGTYYIPHWGVLSYLEKVSQKLSDPDNARFIDLTLDIIRNVSSYVGEGGKSYDNYRTWWYFLKILANIPTPKIPLDVIKLIPAWLNSDFATDLPSSELLTKFLPKFIVENPSGRDIHKAETIFEIVTKLEWRDDPNKFSEQKEKPTLRTPHWLGKGLIDNHLAQQLGQMCSVKPIYEIANKLKEVLRRGSHEHFIDIEMPNKVLIIFVAHVAEFTYRISVNFTDKSEFKKINPFRLQEYKEISTEILTFDLNGCRGKKDFIKGCQRQMNMLDYWQEISPKTASALSDLYYQIYYDGSSIWCRSIKEGSEFKSREVNELLTLILRELMIGKSTSDPEAAIAVFGKFIGGSYEYPLFKRLVLYVIGMNWDEYGSQLWVLLDGQLKDDLFESSNYRAEMYGLLEENVAKFTIKEKHKLIEIFKKGPQKYLPKENQEKYKAYWKQRWYMALRDDPEFLQLYHAEREITNVDIELDFRGESVKFGPGPSPLSEQQILEKSNVDLSNFLAEFKAQDLWRGPNEEGLSKVLTRVVKNNPKKFTDDLSPFLDTKNSYVSDILDGLHEAWNENTSVNWLKIFGYLNRYIDRSEFWEGKLNARRANQTWVISTTIALILDGANDNNWAFDELLLSKAKDLLFLILENLSPTKDQDDSDPLMAALNSAYGKVIQALIHVELYKVRLLKKNDKIVDLGDSKWDADTKEYFNTLLRDGIPEAYTWFGRSLPNLSYLDRPWVETKIEEFESLKTTPLWKVFMQGYFSGNKVYDDLYQLMNTHYKRAINVNFKKENIRDNFVDHITIGYLRGNEELVGSGLFAQILKRWNAEDLDNIIGFLWGQRKFLNLNDAKSPDDRERMSNFRTRIIDFWKWLYIKFEHDPSLTDKDKRILSSASKLTVFLEVIDQENRDWLKLCAANMDGIEEFNYPFFIEYLDGLKDKGDIIYAGRIIGEVFLIMLDAFTPDFDQKHIKSTIEFMYSIGDPETKRIANVICNQYMQRGNAFLVEIYKKFNN